MTWHCSSCHKLRMVLGRKTLAVVELKDCIGNSATRESVSISHHWVDSLLNMNRASIKTAQWPEFLEDVGCQLGELALAYHRYHGWWLQALRVRGPTCEYLDKDLISNPIWDNSSCPATRALPAFYFMSGTVTHNFGGCSLQGVHETSACKAARVGKNACKSLCNIL